MKSYKIIISVFAFLCLVQAIVSDGAEPANIPGNPELGYSVRNVRLKSPPEMDNLKASSASFAQSSLDGGIEFVYGVLSGYVCVVSVNNSLGTATSAKLFDTPFRNWYGATNSDNDYCFYATDSGEYWTGAGAALYKILPAEMLVIKVGNGYGTDPCDPGMTTKMREIAYDEDTGIMYGTDYKNLYTIDTNTGQESYIGSFGVGFDGNPIDQVWSMDYDPSIGKLVMAAQILDSAGVRVASHMYYVDPNTGKATYVNDTSENGVTDIYYSHKSNNVFACGNGPNRFFNVDTTTGLITQMAAIGHNMVGLGGDFEEQEGPPVSLSCTSDVNACAYSKLDEVYNGDCNSSSGSNAAQTTATAFVQEPGQPPSVGQYATFDCNVACYQDAGHSFLASSVDFDTVYNGPNQHGLGGGETQTAFTGQLEIQTDPCHPQGTGGLALIVDGVKNLTENVSCHSIDWQLKVFDGNPDEPLILLTSEDLPEDQTADSADFMGGMFVKAGQTFDLEFYVNSEVGQIEGDIDKDGIVDFNDLAVFVSYWPGDDCNSENNWCQGCDFEPDGDVDFSDFAFFGKDWGQGERQGSSSSFDLDFGFEFRTVGVPHYPGVYNDDCQNAVPIEVEQTVPGTTIGATGTDITTCSYRDEYDVWYKFTPDVNGIHQISVETDDFYYPTVALFDGCGGSQLYCWDWGQQSYFSAEVGTTYWVRIAGYNRSRGNFDVTVTYCPPPDNDECQDAIQIGPYNNYSGTTIGATGTGQSDCGGQDSLDVWYKYVPTDDRPILFSVAPADWDWLPMTVAIYDDCNEITRNELACASYSDCGEEPITHLVYDDFEPWQTYYIRIAREDNGAADFTLYLEPPPENDQCENAIPVQLDEWYQGTTLGATGDSESSCGWGDTRDVWYEYTADTDSTVVFSVQASYECGDMTISLYDSCGGMELACGFTEWGMEEAAAKVAYNVSTGQTYYIRVAYNEERMGDFDLTLTSYPPLTNDECEDAIEVYLDEWQEGATYGATGTSTSSCGWDDRLDVWYKYTATSSETLYFYVEPETEWGPPMTIALYDGCEGSELACDNGEMCASQVEYEVTDGNTYWIRLAREDNQMGYYQLIVSNSSYCDGLW